MNVLDTCSNCDQCIFDIDTPHEQPKNIHEVHITVLTRDPIKFRDMCIQNNIKPILIEFQTTDGMVETHVMTSQRVVGTSEDALREVSRIKSVLEPTFRVIRTKIETSIFNTEMIDQNTDGYFECHLAFNIKPYQDLYAAARKIGGVRVSRNAFKSDGDLRTYMVTVRKYGISAVDFSDQMDIVRSKFQQFGFETDKMIIEFCWKDSYEDLDSNWKIE